MPLLIRVAVVVAVALAITIAVSRAVAPARGAFPGANGLIAFDRITAAGHSIAVVRADRSGLRTLIPNASSPAWSPDGQSLAFHRETTGGDWSLFIANADGSGVHELVGPDNELGPAWSPDGSRLAYFAYPPGGQGEADIYTVKVDGSDRRPVTIDHEGYRTPSWSPDGEWIAFVSQGDIYVAHPDGSGRHVVWDDGTAGTISWSPDGTYVVYDAVGRGLPRRSGAWNDLFISRADGRGRRKQLTATPGYEGSATWSPDGTTIVYSLFTTRGGTSGPADLYMMDARGSKPRPLVRGKADTSAADWQPARR